MKEAGYWMGGVEQVTGELLTKWSKQTLESLRCEAKAEPDGVACVTLRAAGGQREILIVCATLKTPMEILRRTFGFADFEKHEDWTKITLLESVLRARTGRGCLFEALIDPSGEFTALVIIAAEPRSVTKVERSLNLPD